MLYLLKTIQKHEEYLKKTDPSMVTYTLVRKTSLMGVGCKENAKDLCVQD